VGLFDVYLEKELKTINYYKIATLSFFASTFILLIQWLLTGEFVKEIEVYGKLVSYALFLIMSTIIADTFYRGFTTVFRSFRDRNLYELVLENKYRIILYKSLASAIKSTILYLPTLLAVLLLFPKINVIRVFISILLSFSLLIFSIALAYLVSPAILYLRGEDSRVIEDYIERLGVLLVPTMFSFLAFPFGKLVVLALPSVGIVESLRLYLFTGKLNIAMFIVYLAVSLAYFIAGMLLFGLVFDKARKEGWIGLR